MAMIKCPECGQEISDKAKKCIHCGKIFVEEEAIKEELKCIECGATLNISDEVCPNCGFPVEKDVEESHIKPQAVQISSIELDNKTKKNIIGVIIALVICIAVGTVYKIYSGKNNYNTYIDNLEKAQVLMISGGSDAESLCNLTLKVWGNAIFEDRDAETDKYTRPNGYFVDDFNKALANLFADSDTKAMISDIEENQAAVKEVMEKLQDVPEGLDKCYDTVSDLNEAYRTLTDLAIDPSGNYSGYATNKNNAVSDFMSAYEKLDMQIPNRK